MAAGRVWCACGAEMDPVEGRRLLEPTWWLWWRCQANSDHLTVALPLPDADRNVTVVTQDDPGGQLRLL